MPLYLELGNTTAKLAERKGAVWTEERFDSVEELTQQIRGRKERVVALAAPARRSWLEAVRPLCTVHEITREPLLDFIGQSYDTPETLGLDRVLHLFGLGSNGVVISCGTAITVDALIGGAPCFGAILPGFRTAADGLHNRIPTLPLIDPHRPIPQPTPTLPSAHKDPRSSNWLPARSSAESVRNGIVIGTAWGAAALAQELWSVCGGEGSAPVTLTGGDADLLQRNWPLPSAPSIDSVLLFRGMERVAASL